MAAKYGSEISVKWDGYVYSSFITHCYAEFETAGRHILDFKPNEVTHKSRIHSENDAKDQRKKGFNKGLLNYGCSGPQKSVHSHYIYFKVLHSKS